MTDPYRMVFINILGSLFVLIGTLFYRFIYPKKKINLFVLLLLILILPIVNNFRPGDYESGDFNIHIYRIMAFFTSLKEGIFMPSWAGELNATYGNPIFLFNYALPYYVISAFHFLGMSFIFSTKFYLALTLYLSGISMYLLVKEFTGNKLAAFASAIFYVFAPYHLIDVHFRATLGESTIFTIAPIILLLIVRYSNIRKTHYLLTISLLTYLLFLSHPLMAFIFLGIYFLYILFLEGKINIKYKLLQAVSLLTGLIISAYTWIPFIAYSPYMYHFPNINTVGFYPFNLLFFSPWRYGFLFQGPKGELATIIGYTQLFVIVVSILLLLLKKVSDKFRTRLIFWIILFLGTLLMMNPLSGIFWKYIPNIGSMLTLYSRLSLALAFFVSVIAGYFVFYFEKKKKLIFLLLTLTIAYTMLNWGHRRLITEVTDAVMMKNVPYSTLSEGPSYFADTKWADSKHLWFSAIPKQHIEILSGKGFVREIQRTTIKHSYVISAKTQLTIRENTLYFPGWRAVKNGKLISLAPDNKGIITLNLPKGENNLTIFYEDIFPINFFKNLSAAIVIIISSVLLLNFLKLLRQTA